MWNKQRIVAFFGFHLIFLGILVTMPNDKEYIYNAVLNLWYPFIVYLIGLVVFSLMYDDRLSLLFYVLCSVYGLILLLAPSRWTYVLLGFLPGLMYKFCLEFFRIDEEDVSPLLRKSISVLTVLIVIYYIVANVLFTDFLMPSLFIVSREVTETIVESVFICFNVFVLCTLSFLATKNKSVIVLKFSKILILMFVLGLLPYPTTRILAVLIPNFPIQGIDTLYTLLVLPLTIGYVLLDHSSVVVYYNRHEITWVVLTSGSILLLGILFLMGVLGLTARLTVILLLAVFFGICVIVATMTLVSYRKLDNLNENLYDNRNTEFLYQLRFQTLLRNYIMFVLHQLKERERPDAFICTQTHGKIELFDENTLVSVEVIANYFDRIRASDELRMDIEGTAYFVFRFSPESESEGFLALRARGELTSDLLEEVTQYITLLEQVYELEYLKQNYKSLPGVRPQDFVIEKYHYEINRIQQDESQYLHDVALQKMLTIKNFLEIIEIPNVEFKEYLLMEIRELNESLITHMYDLFPFTLRNLSLYECVSELLIRLKKTPEYATTSPQLELEMSKSLNVPRYFFYPIYSFLKQLLWNIFAVAEATTVNIYLYVEDDEITLKLVDDGNRRNMHDLSYAKGERKHGILIINYEVKELNGKLDTELNYPRGSIITIKLPYKEEVAQWK